jgi:sialate O-acetylesterase
MAGQQARLCLGRIVDSDTVYINGTMAGSTGYQHPTRIYDLPGNLLKAGRNMIVIRVINTSGRGGFVKDKPYSLECDGQMINLQGEWKYRVGAAVRELPRPIMIQCQPMGLYNGMIGPLTGYSIKGVIWYQGESNVGRAAEYRKMFPALIADFRKKWNQGDFPFLYVQLPNFFDPTAPPDKSGWAEIRDIQLKTLDVPNTGMAVAIDIGEWNDLHPQNKKDVGYRLYLAALKVAYGDDKVVYSGPLCKSMKIDGKKIVISFSNTGSGLMCKGGGELDCFTISCDGIHFVKAKAEIQGNQVIVWNEQITEPVAARYAWADNPTGINLFNKEGLPASPFTTEWFQDSYGI